MATTRQDGAAQPAAEGRPAGGVQSIARAFELLELIADLGGVASLSQLGARSVLPLPTIHRLVRTLVDLGYVRQLPSRAYALGPRLIRLSENAGRLLGTWATPHLEQLVAAIGESANLALLDGDQVVYAAQVPGRHDMRMHTEVGRRARVHCTAVGKAILADLPDDRTVEIFRRAGAVAQTEHTITTLPAFLDELGRVRSLGYAVDDEEQELGVRCVAVSLPARAGRAAISVSGPSARMTPELVATAVPLLREKAHDLALELDLADSDGRSMS